MAEKWLVIEKANPCSIEVLAITDDKQSAERIAKMCIERTSEYKYSVDSVGYFKSVDDFIRENNWVEDGPMASIYQYVDGKVEFTGRVPMSKVKHPNCVIVSVQVLSNTPNVVAVGTVIPPDNSSDVIRNRAMYNINKALEIMAIHGFTEFKLRYMSRDELKLTLMFEEDDTPSEHVNVMFSVVVDLDTGTLEKVEDK